GGGVEETKCRAERRSAGHKHIAASGGELFGGAQIFGGVGENLETIGGEKGSGLDQAEQLRLQRVVIGDDLELDPLGAEQLACHLRGGDGFLGSVAAGRVGKNAHAKLLDQLPEALTGTRARRL